MWRMPSTTERVRLCSRVKRRRGNTPYRQWKRWRRLHGKRRTSIHYAKRFYESEFKIKNTVDAISHATCGMSIDLGAKAIVACSISGKTARMISRFRTPVAILGLTTNEHTWRKLALSWGVTPAMCETFTSTDVLFYTAKKIAEKQLHLKPADKIVITGGLPNGQTGNTSLIKIEEV